MKIDENKLRGLKTASQHLDEKYGAKGTPSRIAFEEEAYAWMYGELLRERRKELKMTQKQLAEITGKKQAYIARLERGRADIQMSSFFSIARALGIEFTPKFV